MNANRKLRTLIEAPEILAMPGVFDGYSARLVEQAGYPAGFISGAGLSEALLGQPDVGLRGFELNVTACRALAACCTIPLLADADTGYGNAVNVMRTVGDFQDAGAAGVFLEDQVWPKKCGHFQGKQVIPTAEHAAKIKAAADARGERDLFIVARTDARQPLGLDEAIARCLAYKEAGADALFVEAPQSIEELERIGKELPPPLVANMIERGVTPHLSRQELKDLGFQLIVCPLAALYAAAKAVTEVLTELKEQETTVALYDRMLGFDEFGELVGLEQRYADEARYA
jgi:2-methylisocitrate lyase-like PEP mutase family enzyme